MAARLTAGVMGVVVIAQLPTKKASSWALDRSVQSVSPSYSDSLLLATTTVDRVALSQPWLHRPFP